MADDESEREPPFDGGAGLILYIIMIAVWSFLRHPIFMVKQIFRLLSPWHETKEIPDEFVPGRGDGD